jgi:hypothetical protein
MKTPKFEEQYQKIVSAYYKNELRPMNSCACFIGNMFNNNRLWSNIRTVCIGVDGFIVNDEGLLYSESKSFIEIESNHLYTPQEIVDLENNFLKTSYPDRKSSDYTEESLFEAMQSTLEMLRKIHESKGEIIKDYSFIKRELKNETVN